MKVIIIGGGIVGLWTALQAAQAKLSVTLIEQQAQVGSISSARNSAVLHAGIYYKNDSNKALHCVRGYELTLNFLKRNNIPYNLCGKLIVGINTMDNSPATENVLLEEKLIALQENAINNQVKNTEIIHLDQNQYPYLRGSLALHSKNTGIVCLKTYIATLQKLVQEAGVKIMTQHSCVSGESGLARIQDQSGAIQEIKAEYIINSGGLYADEIAAHFGLNDYQIKPNKGIFFLLNRPLPITKLVYPLPFTNSTHLGLHYTLDINGTAYAGPNAQWAESKTDYALETDKNKFFKAFSELTTYYQIEDLLAINRAGLRARLYSNDLPVDDFVIQESPSKVIHLLGIESPGLTSAPSLATEVVGRILG